jgi:hypothetical protein
VLLLIADIAPCSEPEDYLIAGEISSTSDEMKSCEYSFTPSHSLIFFTANYDIQLV